MEFAQLHTNYFCKMEFFQFISLKSLNIYSIRNDYSVYVNKGLIYIKNYLYTIDSRNESEIFCPSSWWYE